MRTLMAQEDRPVLITMNFFTPRGIGTCGSYFACFPFSTSAASSYIVTTFSVFRVVQSEVGLCGKELERPWLRKASN